MMRPLRIAADAERQIERQRAARRSTSIGRRFLRAEAHDRALAVLPSRSTRLPGRVLCRDCHPPSPFPCPFDCCLLLARNRRSAPCLRSRELSLAVRAVAFRASRSNALRRARGRPRARSARDAVQRRIRGERAHALAIALRLYAFRHGFLRRAARARATPRPTGFCSLPPPGPAMPVVATARSAPAFVEHAFGHGDRDLGADCAVLLEQVRAHAEHVALCAVRIADDVEQHVVASCPADR